MRSHRSRPARRILLASVVTIAAVAVIAAVAAWACAPWLPNWLIGDDSLVLADFLGDFGDEIQRLWPKAATPSSLKYADPGENVAPEAQTIIADRAELEEILARTPGLLANQRAAILHNHDVYIADLMSVGRIDVDRLLHGTRTKRPGSLQHSGPPKGVPAELYDYYEGAIAYHDMRFDAAVQAWERLLRRPDEERRHRSTWAAFMIGKVRLRDKPAEAVTWFRRVRLLAGQGFADRLGLASSSLGWEAWAETAQGHWDRALVLYDEQMRTGDPSAFISLQLTCRRILDAGPEAPEAMAPVARNPEARPLFTAWMVSHNTEDSAKAWQKALRDAEVKETRGADRLAWAAYLAGDFDGAASWLDQTEDSAVAKWVRARLLLRDGKLAEARKLLDEAAAGLPKLDMTMDDATGVNWETGEIMLGPQRASGEEAAVQLALGDSVGALDRFLRAGYWLDTAWLAERVLTTDELKAYVDKSWPESLAAEHQPTDPPFYAPMVGGYVKPADDVVVYEIRHLLARRLAREGHPDQALPYLAEDLRPPMEELANHLAAGRGRSRPAADRSRELFQAACLLRHQGLELIGTEAAPDYAVVDGEYELNDEWYAHHPESRTANKVFRSTAGERARLARNPQPAKRFHYRYVAADLAWEAAKLLPDGDERAGMLATAGNWIKGRDPKAAYPFYQELARGKSDLARKAKELHWLPEADACPQEDPQ